MSATEQYVEILTGLKAGDLGLLRAHAEQGLDETVEAFDLFAGLWWPLRQQKGGPPPRREVAWLIAKLYAVCPIPQSRDDTLARQLGRWQPMRDQDQERFGERFDRMLALPLHRLEPALQWALDLIASRGWKVDWVALADDLSRWERESTRVKWAEQFLRARERREPC